MSRLVRILAALLVGLAVLAPAAAPVRAAGVTFGKPDAQVRYNRGITFTIPFSASEAPSRIEIRLRFPGSLGPFIEEIPLPAAGADTLTYELDTTGGGHLVPNTTIEAGWAAFPQGGGDPVLSELQTVRYRDTDHEWRTMKGDLVVVHWYEGDDAFARKALKIGDDAVRSTAQLLGVTETEPIDFYIYGDQASFRAALGPGTRENVAGQAHADIRTLFGLILPSEVDSDWVGVVIPHELVHLVFDTAVGNDYRFPPRWMNEGLAVYLSEGYGPVDQGYVADAVSNGDLLPLTALTAQFPTDPQKTYLAYSESVSAIDHLVRISDRDTMLTLITSYRDGLTDDEAFSRALGMDFAAFQASWLDSVGATAPEAYGPQPNPPGPVPPGWDQPVEGAPTAAPAPSGVPGRSPGAAASVAPTARPGATEAPALPTDTPPSGDGANRALLFVVFGVVIGVVAVGLLVARRRAARP